MWAYRILFVINPHGTCKWNLKYIFSSMCTCMCGITKEHKYLGLIFHVFGISEVIVPWAGKPALFRANSSVTRKFFSSQLVSVVSQALLVAQEPQSLSSPSEGPAPNPEPRSIFHPLVALAVDITPGGDDSYWQSKSIIKTSSLTASPICCFV